MIKPSIKFFASLISPLISSQKYLKFSPFNLLPLRWGRMKVGVDKTILVPLPSIPSHQERGDSFWWVISEC
jgi:hypothetical protein